RVADFELAFNTNGSVVITGDLGRHLLEDSRWEAAFPARPGCPPACGSGGLFEKKVSESIPSPLRPRCPACRRLGPGSAGAHSCTAPISCCPLPPRRCGCCWADRRRCTCLRAS